MSEMPVPMFRAGDALTRWYSRVDSFTNGLVDETTALTPKLDEDSPLRNRLLVTVKSGMTPALSWIALPLLFHKILLRIVLPSPKLLGPPFMMKMPPQLFWLLSAIVLYSIRMLEKTDQESDGVSVQNQIPAPLPYTTLL